jgi:hypothetical protein
LHGDVRQGPAPTAGKRADRDARLAAALRDNLRRRKEQARAQTARRDGQRGVPPGLSGTALSSKSRYRGDDTAD